MSPNSTPYSDESQAYVSNLEVFRLLVKSVKDYAIFMLDTQGNILTWNEGAQRIKGYTADEIIGKHFSIFYTSEALDRNHPQHELEIARAEGRYEEEGWRLRKNGDSFWANVVITAVSEAGQLIGYAKVTRDLTERKLAEQQRDLRDKLLAETNEELKRALETKSRFLSTISHEVRTPMAGIIGLTELLTMRKLSDDDNAIVQSIFESSKRLLQLLNNLLDSARMESGQLSIEYREFPIRPMLGDIRQLIAADATKKNIKLEGFCDPKIPEYVCGDEIRIRQILTNLAFNAVKFTEKGSIEIKCELQDNNNEDDDERDRIRFTVSDTGIGIKPNDAKKLYQPFVQADAATARIYGGSGLGLNICKHLAELMGGTVGFNSVPGQGSNFWVDVPFNKRNCPI